MKKERRDELRRIGADWHKYTERIYVAELNDSSLAEMEEAYSTNIKKPLPTYEQMMERILTKLIEEKFRFVHVAPERANCVIRIYRKEMDVDGKPGGVCGAVCFARNVLGQWTTIKKDVVKKMDFGETYEVEYWTSLFTKYPGPVKANYFDVYLKVTSF